MKTALALRFAIRPDLDATMDIQIPALAWQSTGGGRYRRTFHLDSDRVEVTAWQSGHNLRFGYDTDPATAARLDPILRATFPTMIAELDLGADPILRALHERYAGVVVMWADPFEALVLTVLSQNRSGETVRQVFPVLADACGGASAVNLAALGETRLRQLIHSAGPYKAPRLAALAAGVAAAGEATFTDRVVHAPTDTALTYLESLPGVAHKTAACVLVFAARTRTTLPVDTHLFRVAARLGLAHHDGRNTKTAREALIAALLRHGPDMALAHFVFLLVGRSTCTAAAPTCGVCFLRASCPTGRPPLLDTRS
jgi:endonuclease III